MAEPCADAGAPWSWTDATLVAAVRGGQEAALAELYARFHPFLVRVAQRHGRAAAECEELATDVLTAVALLLLDPATPAPRSLPTYLATALRNELALRHRAAARRARRHVDAAWGVDDLPPRATPGQVAERVTVGPLHSEHSRRASAGPAGDALTLDPALAALAARLERELTETDQLLLVWLSHHVPLRTIAEWLGVRYDAAAKRASRLRARLRTVAFAHADALPPDERRRLHRFFARAGIAAHAPDEEIRA